MGRRNSCGSGSSPRWFRYEPQRGKPQYEYADKAVEWCRQRGIRLKGHPLLWGSRAGIPPWSQGQPSPEIQRQRVADIMQRYQGQIEFWEVVNEPSHLAEPKLARGGACSRQPVLFTKGVVCLSFVDCLRHVFRCWPNESRPLALAVASVKPGQRRAEGVVTQLAAGPLMAVVETEYGRDSDSWINSFESA